VTSGKVTDLTNSLMTGAGQEVSALVRLVWCLEKHHACKNPAAALFKGKAIGNLAHIMVITLKQDSHTKAKTYRCD